MVTMRMDSGMLNLFLAYSVSDIPDQKSLNIFHNKRRHYIPSPHQYKGHGPTLCHCPPPTIPHCMVSTNLFSWKHMGPEIGDHVNLGTPPYTCTRPFTEYGTTTLTPYHPGKCDCTLLPPILLPALIFHPYHPSYHHC